MGRSPKVLFWDVETTDVELSIRTYGLKNYTKYFNHKDIQRDWSMLGASWKFKGDKNPSVVSVKSNDVFNDEGVIRVLYEVLKEADVLVGHNSDAFDLKKFNTRAVIYGLPPLHIKPSQTVDTLKIARKYFKFTSNTLAYIANYLGVEAKDQSPNWRSVMEGCDEELRYMRDYNKQDVLVTEQVYDILKGYDTRHPNLDVIAETRDCSGDKVMVCRTCLSPNLRLYGNQYSPTGKRQRYMCRDCGSATVGKFTKVL